MKIFGPSIIRIIFYPGVNLILIILPIIFLLLGYYLGLKHLKIFGFILLFPWFIWISIMIILQANWVFTNKNGIVIYGLFMPTIEIYWKLVEKIKTEEKIEGEFSRGDSYSPVSQNS